MSEISVSNQALESVSETSVSKHALECKKKLASSFFKKGIIIAIISGMCYGLYTAFLTYATTKGVWVEWYAEDSALSPFVVAYLVAAISVAFNDSASAIWALCIAAYKGKLGDFFRCLNTKPGHVMIVAALIGGPIAGTAYIVALQMAGSIVVPISALCPAIGAILGKVLFKQQLNMRMKLGIAICVISSMVIGSVSIGAEAPEGMFLGICIAVIAALGWGIEGCVAGYGTTMIDYEIGISIRQVVSGLSNLLILVPIFGIMAGGLNVSTELIGRALTDSASLPFFAISGFFALFAFSLWYKGNSMCGAALGMACNGAYSFWGPFFCWIVLGVFAGLDGWALPPIVWFGAVLMFCGILTIATNPLELFKGKEAN